MTLAPEAKAYLEEQDAMWRAAGPNLTPAQVRKIAGRDSGSGGVLIIRKLPNINSRFHLMILMLAWNG